MHLSICFNQVGLVDRAICLGLYDMGSLLVAHGAIPNWLSHDTRHIHLVKDFPLDFVESLLISAACLTDKTESERAVTDELWYKLWKMSPSSTPLTLGKLSIKAIRSSIRSTPPCHEKTVWLDINTILPNYPNRLIDLLKMKKNAVKLN